VPKLQSVVKINTTKWNLAGDLITAEIGAGRSQERRLEAASVQMRLTRPG
jgi:hypothetical protein